MIGLLVVGIGLALGLQRLFSRQAKDGRGFELVRIRTGHAFGPGDDFAVDGSPIRAASRWADSTTLLLIGGDGLAGLYISAKIDSLPLGVERIRTNEARREALKCVQSILSNVAR